MVIDLRKCIGCGSCSIVCAQANKIPYNLWRRVFDCGISGSPERMRMYLPMSCMHCSKPPCLDVCPTTATFRRPDGIIDINYEFCIGCGYCIVACPYFARTIIFRNGNYLDVDPLVQDPGKVSPISERIGVCTKCNFCIHRVCSGLAKGLLPGLDPDATPVCVISCTSGALSFGDLNNPQSEVTQLCHENKTVRLQRELETEPSVFYIMG